MDENLQPELRFAIIETIVGFVADHLGDEEEVWLSEGTKSAVFGSLYESIDYFAEMLLPPNWEEDFGSEETSEE